MDEPNNDVASAISNIPEIELQYLPTISPSTLPKISDSKDAYKIFLHTWDMGKIAMVEQCKVMLLNRDNRVLGICTIASCGITDILIDSRLIFALALKCIACNIILAHNHPSGSTKPSEADRQLTQNIKEGAKLLHIKLLDHLIVTKDGFCSMADNGMI